MCTVCQQSREMASNARPVKGGKKTKLQQGDGMLEQIKRLEAHVRLMERSYIEQLRKRATEQVGLEFGCGRFEG